MRAAYQCNAEERPYAGQPTRIIMGKIFRLTTLKSAYRRVHNLSFDFSDKGMHQLESLSFKTFG